MPLKRTAATSIRTILLVSAFLATPAFGQTANLTVTLTGPFRSGTASAPNSVSFGGSAVYRLVIANSGPSRATGVTLNATLPDELNSADAPPSATHCTPIGATPFPCTIDTDDGDIDDGASVSITINTSVTPPDPLPATCPTTVATPTFTVTAANAATATASAPTNVRPFAELETNVTGPGPTEAGQNVTYNVSITNLGPCPAPNAGYFVDTPNSLLQFVSDTLGSKDDCAGQGCDAGVNVAAANLAPGATTNVGVTYKPLPLQGDTKSNWASVAHSFGAASDIDDPGSSAGASVTTSLHYDKASGTTGCNSAGGAGGILGIVLMGLAAWRRRRP